MISPRLPSSPPSAIQLQMAEVARRSFPGTPFVLLGNSPFLGSSAGGVFALPHGVLICLLGPVEWSAVMWVITPVNEKAPNQKESRLLLMEGRDALRRLLHPESDDPGQPTSRAIVEAAVRAARAGSSTAEVPKVILSDAERLTTWLHAWAAGTDAARACGVEWVDVDKGRITAIRGLLGPVDEYAAALASI